MITRILQAVGTAAALLWASQAAALLPIVSGEAAVAPTATAAPRLRGPSAKAVSRVQLPPVPEDAIAEVRRANARGMLRHERRVVIGVTRAAGMEEALPAFAPLRWTPGDGGQAAQAAVTSPGAGSMRLAVDLKGVPEDVEMVFFGSADPSRLEGPLRVGDVRDRTLPWWSPVTEGETQTVEFFVPSRHDPRLLPLAIVGASHIFSTPSSRFSKRTQDIGDSGSCNVDIACSALNGSSAFQHVADSVAQMVFTDGAFTALCTGSLLNDSDPSSQVPWFYSANHCFENEIAPYKTPAQMQVVANTLATLWSFEANACVNGRGSDVPLATWSQLAGGATLAFNSPQRDVLLVRLNNAPPAGAFYSGWDPNPISGGTSVISVHHPRGDLKKVTQGLVQRLSVQGVAGGSETFIEVKWSLGTTEPGSSGGGLWSFDGSQYLFRGGLWGGDALCTNMNGTDNFSRFEVSYAALAPFLGASAGSGIDYTDLWWNAAESGWGMTIVQHASGVIFAVWYTYGEDGKRTWFVLPSATWSAGNVYTGAIYSTAGPAYTSKFDSSLVRRTQVGNATLAFSDANHATFTYSVQGVSGTRAITRLPF